jgi:cell division protease FtsH
MLGTQAAWRPHGYSDETATAIDSALKVLMAEAFTVARAILENNRALLCEGAADLLAHETLTQADLNSYAARLHAPEALRLAAQ